jgi:hypothetical protein
VCGPEQLDEIEVALRSALTAACAEYSL